MNTKLLVSFAAEDLETIDQVVEKYGLPSRASAVRLAIRRMSGERGKVDDDGRGGSGVRVAGERPDEGVGVGVPADGIQGTGAVDEGERGGGVEVGGAAAAGKVDPRVAALLGSLGPKLRLKPAAEVVPLEVESEDAVPWEPAAEVVPEGMVYLKDIVLRQRANLQGAIQRAKSDRSISGYRVMPSGEIAVVVEYEEYVAAEKDRTQGNLTA
jgi:hypothetical protein